MSDAAVSVDGMVPLRRHLPVLRASVESVQTVWEVSDEETTKVVGSHDKEDEEARRDAT